jgi:hypothetical protein
VEGVWMKKLNIVLNETSIINFPFLWKLIKRYKFLSISVPVIAAVYSISIFMGQNTIFSGEVGFKYISEGSNSPTSMIFSMLGEKTSKLDPTEIISYGSSVDFQYKVADEILESSELRKLNFNSINSKEISTFDEIFADCKDSKECRRDKIARIIGSFYNVKMDTDIIDRYHLIVRTLDHRTTDTLVKIISKTIDEDRLKQIRYFVTSQVKISEELLSKKKNEVNMSFVKGMVNEKARLLVKIDALHNRTDAIRRIYYSDRTKLNKLETERSQTKKILARSNKASNNELFKVVEAKKLKQKNRQLRDDIASIKTSFSSADVSGSDIIGKLKNELEVNERRLASIGDVASATLNEDFAASKENKQMNTEHNYNVSIKQFNMTKVEFEKLNKDFEETVKKKADIEIKLLDHQPNLQLIKLLEQKLVQLKLAESTIVSDLIFDSFQSELSSYKKIAKTKMIFVSIFFSCFLLLFVIILRYIFDGRIYDEYELKNNFEDLEIIGNTPDFH